MLPIHNENIASVGDYWMAMCKCGAINKYSTKNSALNMIERGSCRCCKKDYRSVNDAEARIYKNKNGKWDFAHEKPNPDNSNLRVRCKNTISKTKT